MQVNIYVGSGLLSMPYALAKCGWLGIPLLAVVTGCFCVSAHLIVRAFASLPQGVPHSYPELGEPLQASFPRLPLLVSKIAPHAGSKVLGGRFGAPFVASCAIFEFFGGSVRMCLGLQG